MTYREATNKALSDARKARRAEMALCLILVLTPAAMVAMGFLQAVL